MPYSAVIFDMDGTLIDSMPAHVSAWRRFFEEELGNHSSVDDLVRNSAGMTIEEIIVWLTGRASSDQEVLRLAAKKESIYRSIARTHVSPIEGVFDVLEFLHQGGVPMAIATAAPPDNIEMVLEQFCLKRYFNTVVGAADVFAGKPNPECFLMAASRLNVEPARCLVFEDSIQGFEAARRAGMRVIALTTTLHSSEINLLCRDNWLEAVIGDYCSPELWRVLKRVVEGVRSDGFIP